MKSIKEAWSHFPTWAHDPKSFFKFEVIYESKRSSARVGRIYTNHGIIETPSFVPVGTNATLKCIDSSMANECDVDLMFCNTYHLMIQPGTEVVRRCGGLHKFMNREDRPLITDSGGFQVFSMQAGSMNLSSKVGLKGAGGKKRPNTVLGVTEKGVTFKSYKDGRKLFLSPETCVQAQKDLGADIIIPLDHLPAYNVTQTELKESFRLSHLWEEQSLAHHMECVNDQAMYSVVHGGMDFKMRTSSIEKLSKLPFDGIAIGGSLGKSREDLISLLKFVMPQLNPVLPVHLLGIGDIDSISKAVPLGIDTFDSSYPTKVARHGYVFVEEKPRKVADLRKSKVGCCFLRRNYPKTQFSTQMISHHCPLHAIAILAKDTLERICTIFIAHENLLFGAWPLYTI